VSERLLEKAGVLERLDSRENLSSVRIESDLPSLVDLVPLDAKVQRKVLQGIERIVGEIRHERVYFNPTKLAATLELEMTAFNRAVKELSRLQSFDYCPPFRGRAIHMLERKTAFSKLQIDWKELDDRKAEEYERLEDMLRYARTSKCRQRYILDYFGDPTGGMCGICDRCGGIPDSVDIDPQAVATEENATTGAVSKTAEKYADILEAVRMTLAGVARTKGFVGKGMIAQMLCGSQSKEMTKRKFDSLSTFGLLKFLTQTEAGDLLDALINSRLIEQVENQRFRPVIKLTPNGERVMRSEIPLPANFVIAEALRLRIVTCPSDNACQCPAPPHGSYARDWSSPG
jgi:ATP-dependent DNA helicase RecQ